MFVLLLLLSRFGYGFGSSYHDCFESGAVQLWIWSNVERLFLFTSHADLNVFDYFSLQLKTHISNAQTHFRQTFKCFKAEMLTALQLVFLFVFLWFMCLHTWLSAIKQQLGEKQKVIRSQAKLQQSTKARRKKKK